MFSYLQKQAEKLIVAEFIKEKKDEIHQTASRKKKNSKTMQVVNENTGE